MICMSQTFYTTLTAVYDLQTAGETALQLENLINHYRGRIPVPADSALTECDAMLITYGDQVRTPGQAPLQTLAEFSEMHLRGTVNGIHVLPFFPWSSDDGFSIMDYREVDEGIGEWHDIEGISRNFRLMVDGVINHTSVKSGWFQAFLHNEAPWRDYFLTVSGSPDLSEVVRPRALPLLTEFQTGAGPRQVWTTFSADQADLDYHNPEVLLEIIDILLMYVEHGAQFIRLDAIAYLWKEIGTSCIHLPQTHALVRLLRAVFREAAPHVRLITETNVPHTDNIAYFGDGTDEAHLVYNFALPPLVMHALISGDASVLSQWAAGLELPSSQTAFFNFLASHDGIGLNPARGILSETEIDGLVAKTQAHGGLVSYKQNADGTQTAYELNINYFDALSDPAGNEPLQLQIDRFMASQAILLALRGLPGIYFHSLFGSRGWHEGPALTGRNRTINRQKLERAELEAALADPGSLRAQVFGRYRQLLIHRAASAAFDPHGGQSIEDFGRGIFAVRRNSPDGSSQVLCLQNVTAQTQTAGKYSLTPYQTLWVDNPHVDR